MCWMIQIFAVLHMFMDDHKGAKNAYFGVKDKFERLSMYTQQPAQDWALCWHLINATVKYSVSYTEFKQSWYKKCYSLGHALGKMMIMKKMMIMIMTEIICNSLAITTVTTIKLLDIVVIIIVASTPMMFPYILYSTL